MRRQKRSILALLLCVALILPGLGFRSRQVRADEEDVKDSFVKPGEELPEGYKEGRSYPFEVPDDIPNYTVTLHAGDGAGDDITYSARDEGKFFGDLKDGGSPAYGQFYTNGKEFCLCIPSCPDFFQNSDMPLFVGWTLKGAPSSLLKPGTRYQVYEDIELTAQWKTDTSHSITYEPMDQRHGGWNSSSNPTTSETGTEFEVCIVPTYPDSLQYILDAFIVTDSKGNKTEITDINVLTIMSRKYYTGVIVMPDDNITISTRWIINRMVTFDPQGGTVSPTSVWTVNNKLETLPVPTKENYYFDGWYTQSIGGERITTDTVFEEDTTIYAHWEILSSYTLAFPETIQVTSGTEFSTISFDLSELTLNRTTNGRTPELIRFVFGGNNGQNDLVNQEDESKTLSFMLSNEMDTNVVRKQRMLDWKTADNPQPLYFYIAASDLANAKPGTYTGSLSYYAMWGYADRPIWSSDFGFGSIPVEVVIPSPTPTSTPSPTPTPIDYSEYRVTIDPGEGKGEPITYWFAEQESIPNWRYSNIFEFYYEDDGSLGFRLHENVCPESFSPPDELHYFGGYEDVFTNYLTITSKETTFKALWKPDFSKIPDASFEISTSKTVLDGSGYTDIPCKLESLSPGKVETGVSEADWGEETEYAEVNGLKFYYYDRTLLDENENEIHFHAGLPDHSGTENFVTLDQVYTTPGAEFNVVVYIDPNDYVQALPGTYTGEFVLGCTWMYRDEPVIDNYFIFNIQLVIPAKSTPVPTPAKPANVKASAESAAGIKVSWNAVSGATGYQVFRATSATGSFTSLGTVTTTSKVSSSLKAGTTYYYKVRAYKEVNGTKYYGAYSSVVSATTKLAVPANVKASAESTTSIKVSWSAVSGATGYQVFRAASADGTFTSLGTVTTTSKVSTGLKTATTYYYKVRAYKEADGKKIYSDYSTVVNATTKLGTVTNAKAASASATSINVSWSAVSGATGYQVYRSTSADGTFASLGTVTATSKVSTGLKTGTTYYYKVRAYKEVNGKKIYGEYSKVVSAMPKPSAPTGVKAVSASATSITVSWSKATGATGYEVYRSTSADGTFTKLGAVTTTGRNCAGLKTGTTYYFKVRSYVEVNGTKYYSGYSTVVSATPKKA